MDTKKIAYFLEIVKHQSILKAARKIGINKSILSKYLKSLEEELGCQLYVHYNKTFRLTHIGESVSKYFQRFIAVHEGLQRELGALREKPGGQLNIVCSSGFVHFFMLQVLGDFLEKHPDVFLSFKTNDIKPLLEAGNDICIGPKIDEPGIVSICIHSYVLKMYASKSYLEKAGYPRKPEDLNFHNLIAYSQDLQSTMMDFDWHLKYGAPNGVARTPFLEITSSYALKRAAEMGLGIITFSQFIIERDNSGLIDIFPDEGVKVDVYFSYRKEQETFWALTLYRDYLLDYEKNLAQAKERSTYSSN